MNLGKLVREKMKQMAADLSGEYVDNSGKHFAMKLSGEGYTIGYGGEAKREVEVTKPQAMKLVSACRKLGADADKKELALKKLEACKGHQITTVHEINGTYPVIDGKKIDHSCDGPTEATQVAKDMIDSGKVK